MNLFGDLESLQAVARRSLDNSEHRVSRCSGQSGLVAFQHLAHGLSGYPAYVNPVATVFSGTAEVSRTASFLNVPTAAEIFLVR